MLFAGLYLASALAAFHRLRFKQCAVAITGSIAAVVAGNVLRATALFFPESGIISLPQWAHPAVGVLVFASLAALLFIAASRLKGQLA